MSWQTTLQVILAVATGGGLTVGADVLLDSRRAKRDAVNHDRDRKEAFDDRRIEFELETLTKLHSALTNFLRKSTRFHLDDRAIAKKSGDPYGSYQTGNDSLAEELRLANVEVGQLSGLVLKEQIRDDIARVTRTSADLSYGTKTIEEADAVHMLMLRQGSDVLADISQRIREIYARGLQ